MLPDCTVTVKYDSNRMTESRSFLPWIISLGSIWIGSFQPNFGVGLFGLGRWVVLANYSFLGWVNLALHYFC